ncbi:helix-turn-helix transcriptional regulator [Dickeya poaceiphila]|uniref:Helix-turn-helix transcriptional regulator n=1 Tax=Dickeya poaceiphila TaxID=568768 RepID=A0A5B8I804_9GAMM|nr:PAS and helix-turn-helix domain-containing protein [Dickeya poaceiphila]QDX30531.1 helix-turn-helix transcriptional regulator [Dickeya poaceiphila]
MNNLGGIITVLDNLREPWGIKDLDSKSIYMNSAAYAYTNTPKNFNVEGKLDAEFPVGWADFADEMVEHDRRTLQANGERVIVIETYNWFDSPELVPYQCEKIPLFSEEKEIIGTLWTSRPIRTLSPVYLSAKQRAPVEWTTSYEGPFSATEMETLFLLLCQFSKEEIAARQNLSKRTIDNRIQRMYQKVGVHNLRQFEEYCYQNNLHGYIPPSLLVKGTLFL